MSSSVKRNITLEDLQFERLNDVVSVVYGAVIAYGFLLLMEMCAKIYRPTAEIGRDDAIVRTLFLAFVSNYMIADFVEARVYTHAVPYCGRGRFTIDLLVAMVFLGACQAANEGSALVLAAVTVTFVLGAIWACFLIVDGRTKFTWRYPGTIVTTHIGAAILLGTGFHVAPMALGIREAKDLWLAYAAWLGFSAAAKKVFGAPESGFDVMTFGVCDYAGRKAVGLIRTGYNYLLGET